jgi:hypothetical protein
MPTTATKVRLFENVARLRRAERDAPQNRDIPAVRASLEQELGDTVSQRLAARLLGVSHTGIRRWIKSGDVPTVFNREGRLEVPVSALLDLHEQVQYQRCKGRRHVLEPGITEARDRARRIPPVTLPDDANGHRTAELRSLAYHTAVARRLHRGMVDDARRLIWVWLDQGNIDPRHAEQWERVLAQPIGEVRRLITEDSDRGRDLRQNSPFAGVLSEAERRAILQRSTA